MNKQFLQFSPEQEPIVYDRKEHCINRRSIDPDALGIMFRLFRSGHKGYLVGGGVRDLLLGKKPKDFDIVTDATPRRLKSIFRNSRIIGRRFKLIHIFFPGGKIIEVATFRDFTDAIGVEEDLEEKAETLANDNQFGSEASDAYRRDITINGLFYNPETFSVIDYVGGMRDIKDGVVRVIGNPDQRFREDPVRMTRVLRHAARTGFKIEAEAWDSLKRNRELVRVCPPMRVYEEIKKDFSSSFLGPTLQLMAQSDMLELIIPELLHNFPAISNTSSLISKALKRVDDLTRKAVNVPPSIVLALIIASLDDESFKMGVLSERLCQESEQKAIIGSTFRLLQITRKDREQVEELFSFWAALTRVSAGLLKVLLRDKQLFEQVHLFLKVIDSPLRENLGVLTDKDLEGLDASIEVPQKRQRRQRRRGHRSARKNS
jgi:poly(A) polymerase